MQRSNRMINELYKIQLYPHISLALKQPYFSYEAEVLLEKEIFKGMLYSDIFQAERERSIVGERVQDRHADKWCEAKFHSDISATPQTEVIFVQRSKLT